MEIRESVERIVFLSIKYLTHHAISFTDLLSFSLSPFEEGSSAILRPSLRGPPSGNSVPLDICTMSLDE